MRHYGIKTIDDCITFTCTLCKYSVTILEFSSQNGSRRTQAARVMNEHAAAVHQAPTPVVWPSHLASPGRQAQEKSQRTSPLAGLHP